MEMLAQSHMPTPMGSVIEEGSLQIAVRTVIMVVQGGKHFPICKDKKHLGFSLSPLLTQLVSGSSALLCKWQLGVQGRLPGAMDKRTYVSNRYSSLFALILSLELNLCCCALGWNSVCPQISAQGKFSIILAPCAHGRLPSLWAGVQSKSKLSFRKEQPQITDKLEFGSW